MSQRSSTLKPGDRVEFATHTDRWMRGDRYGTVLATNVKSHGIRTVRVLPDRGSPANFAPGILTLVRKADAEGGGGGVSPLQAAARRSRERAGVASPEGLGTKKGKDNVTGR